MEPETYSPIPKRVTVVVGLCGKVAFTAVEPPDAFRDCLTECLAEKIIESGTYEVRCNSAVCGDPMASDHGRECSQPCLKKLADEVLAGKIETLRDLVSFALYCAYEAGDGGMTDGTDGLAYEIDEDVAATGMEFWLRYIQESPDSPHYTLADFYKAADVVLKHWNELCG